MSRRQFRQKRFSKLTNTYHPALPDLKAELCINGYYLSFPFQHFDIKFCFNVVVSVDIIEYFNTNYDQLVNSNYVQVLRIDRFYNYQCSSDLLNFQIHFLQLSLIRDVFFVQCVHIKFCIDIIVNFNIFKCVHFVEVMENLFHVTCHPNKQDCKQDYLAKTQAPFSCTKIWF